MTKETETLFDLYQREHYIENKLLEQEIKEQFLEFVEDVLSAKDITIEKLDELIEDVKLETC